MGRRLVYRGRAALAAGAVLCLTACTPSLESRDGMAGVSVPEGWTAESAATPAGAVEGEWLTEFDDARLLELVGLAQTRNPDVLIAAARLEQAAANARISFADKLPTLDAVFNPTRLQSRFTAPNGFVATVRQSQFSLAGQVSWELDVWGRIAANVAAADVDFQANQADLDAARLSLSANVTRTYFNIISAQEQLSLANESVASFQRSLDIVESRYRRGITNALDVRLAANSLEGAKALRVQRANQLDEARRQLEVLLADYPAGEVAVTPDLPTLYDITGLGIPSDLVERRPDVEAAFLRLAAADYRVKAAKRQLLPSFTINGQVGNQTERFSDFLDFRSLVWRITGGLTQPLFQGGRLRANVKLNKARADEAMATYTRTLLTAFQEVETTLANERFLADREVFLAEAANQAAAATTLARNQYSRGLTQILNLLDAQRRELDSRGQLIDIRNARVQNRVNLHLALGGPGLPQEQAPSQDVVLQQDGAPQGHTLSTAPDGLGTAQNSDPGPGLNLGLNPGLRAAAGTAS